MKQQVLFVLLNEYADWEGAFLASALNAGVMPGSDTKYVCKVVAPTMDAVIFPSEGSVRCPIILSKLCQTIMQLWC